MPDARSAAKRSSHVFPMPASPVTTRTPLWPSRAAESRDSTRRRSGPRPTCTLFTLVGAGADH